MNHAARATFPIKRLLYLVVLIVVFGSCEKEEPECYEPKLVLTRARFVIKMDSTYVDTANNFQDTTITIFRDSILEAPTMYTIQSEGSYQVIGEQTPQLGVALDPRKQQTTYVIQFNVQDSSSNNRDTLTYFYQTQTHFISNNCGFTNYFRLDSFRLTHHFLDSAAIVNREVTSVASADHLHLYFFNQ